MIKYRVFIENPRSNAEKSIIGVIEISNKQLSDGPIDGIEKKAVGRFFGFPDGGKIGPINTGFQKENDEVLINQVLDILILEINNRYINTTDFTGRFKAVKDDGNFEPDNIENIIDESRIDDNIEFSPSATSDIFKIDLNGIITSEKLGKLKIIEKIETEEPIMFDFGDEEQDLSLLDDEFSEELFKGAEELSIEMEQRENLQDIDLGSPNPTSFPDIDFSSNTFVGSEWKSFNINKVMSEIEKTEYKPNSLFKESLKSILFFIKNDTLINDPREGAYLLATAYEEAGYSLQRWESDYQCKGAGIPYGKEGPCQKALNYFKSTCINKDCSKTKKNYYDLGTDKNGLPYFGRGLIQLTGKGNYDKYGKKIGVDLLNNANLALVPENSYKIAVNYLVNKTFKYIKDETLKLTIKGSVYTGLRAARRSVNGGETGIDKINLAYKKWVNIFLDTNLRDSIA
jgi:predicted chitinase